LNKDLSLIMFMLRSARKEIHINLGKEQRICEGLVYIHIHFSWT